MELDYGKEDDFRKSDFYKQMENGVISDRYENPVRWGSEYYASEDEYRISLNYDKSGVEPHILFCIQPRDGVEMSERDILKCMKDLCDEFDVAKASGDFVNVFIIEGDADDVNDVEARYGYCSEINDEKADAFLSVDVVNPENAPEISEGRLGYAKILNGAKNDIISACMFLDEKLPVRESVRYTDAEKGKNVSVEERLRGNQDEIIKRSAAGNGRQERDNKHKTTKETVSI